MVGVGVSRNYGTVVVWYWADDQAWPVECAHSSLSGARSCRRRLIAKPRPRLPIAAAAP